MWVTVQCDMSWWTGEYMCIEKSVPIINLYLIFLVSYGMIQTFSFAIHWTDFFKLQPGAVVTLLLYTESLLNSLHKFFVPFLWSFWIILTDLRPTGLQHCTTKHTSPSTSTSTSTSTHPLPFLANVSHSKANNFWYIQIDLIITYNHNTIFTLYRRIAKLLLNLDGLPVPGIAFPVSDKTHVPDVELKLKSAVSCSPMPASRYSPNLKQT